MNRHEKQMRSEAIRDSENRYVYSAACSWFGPIGSVGKTSPINGHSLPCCPHCGSVLFEVPTRDEFWSGAPKHEADGHPGYVKFLEWLEKQGEERCWKSFTAAAEVYRSTGAEVKL